MTDHPFLAPWAVAFAALQEPVAAAPAGPEDVPEGATRRAPVSAERYHQVVVVFRGLDPDRLRPELSLRLSDRALTWDVAGAVQEDGREPPASVRGAGGGDDPRPGDRSAAPAPGYDPQAAPLVLQVEGPSPVRVRARTPDGRIFERRVEPAPGERPERLAAVAAAHLLAGIESGRATPVAVTPPAPATGAAADAPPPASAPAHDRPRVAGPRWAPPAPSVGLAAQVGSILGPGLPRDGSDVFAAWSGALSLRGVFRGGGTARLELRVAGRPVGAGAALVRFRLAVGGGHLVRRGPAAFEVGGALAVEPLLPLRDGRPVSATRDGPARLVLLGAFVYGAAGWWFSTAAGAVQVGPYLTLGGSMAVGDGITVPIFEAGGGGTRVRAGAFELATGLEMVFRFRLERRRGRRGTMAGRTVRTGRRR